MNSLREKIAAQGIARQQWRARIETILSLLLAARCGCIARQQWRARIETPAVIAHADDVEASPASNGGRGLKPDQNGALTVMTPASPASNGGRGLKLGYPVRIDQFMPHRPPAMAGAD